ncbi:DUF2884 family protein [Aliikangiella coralliicola]|uniref:DUF2884 family protein n=1 Tax=Aliikangiella coralliicola TaxID=2592383 RepID=A0A545UGL2_9GAMM|nr:DUF2884 family protein [Aliikangiella coralliicola]TQV88622.1 DUF2884 family protein [Aliikangiella coralliicola]
MKKILLTAMILGASGIANADSNVCEFSTDFNINIDEDRVVFDKNSGDAIEFKGDKLFINGEAAKLTAKQKRASEKLQAGARAMVPKIAEIAVEGAELGIKATTIALTALVGDDQGVHSDLIQPIEAISNKIKQNISATSLNTQALEASFENAFDEEFEKLIEVAATKYAGKIAGSVLTAVFSGDQEELKDFEFRMENMERQMEEYVEANATEIEVKAEALCANVEALDKFDTVLEAVDGYPEGGLLHKGDKDGFKFSGITFNR